MTPKKVELENIEIELDQSQSDSDDLADIEEITLRTVLKITRKDCSSSLFLTILFVMAIGGILPITAFIYSQRIIEEMAPLIDAFKENGIFGCLIYMLIYTIWVPLCIPSSLLTLLGSHLFTQTYGFIVGSILCFFSIILSHIPIAFFCFWLTRRCFKKKV